MTEERKVKYTFTSPANLEKRLKAIKKFERDAEKGQTKPPPHRKLDPWNRLSVLQSDSLNAKDELKGIARAARLTKKRKEVQESLIFGKGDTGRTRLLRACDDVSILHTDRNGDPMEPVEEAETFDEMYEREAGQSVPKYVNLKERFDRNYDSWLEAMRAKEGTRDQADGAEGGVDPLIEPSIASKCAEFRSQIA